MFFSFSGATNYNVAKYLKNQLDSLLSQSYEDICIIARDDGSTDQSYEILQDFAQHSSLHVKVLEDSTNVGAKKSFELLMNKALKMKAQYMMFCDQDDVWHKNKVEKMFSKMKEQEDIYKQSTPILIHSDLTVVDKNLHVIAPSLWRYQHIDRSKKTLSYCMVDNNITGCTAMINQALAEKVKTIPNKAIMHDWWIAMVASVFGKIAYIKEPLILYRQHGSNDTWAKEYGWRYIVKKLFQKPSLSKYRRQSGAFLSLYKNALDASTQEMLEAFFACDTMDKWGKLRVLRKYKIRKNGFIRNLGLIIFA
jgi:GT2 family glycosyltransferase